MAGYTYVGVVGASARSRDVFFFFCFSISIICIFFFDWGRFRDDDTRAPRREERGRTYDEVVAGACGDLC